MESKTPYDSLLRGDGEQRQDIARETNRTEWEDSIILKIHRNMLAREPLPIIYNTCFAIYFCVSSNRTITYEMSGTSLVHEVSKVLAVYYT